MLPPFAHASAMEDAIQVLSRFCIPLYQDGKGRPFQHGTGFIVVRGGDHYLVSAAHVLDAAPESELFYYTTERELRPLSGRRVRTLGEGKRDDDLIDIGVLLLTGPPFPPYPQVEKYAVDASLFSPKCVPRWGKNTL